MHLSGQELRDFTVSKPETRGTENGREGLANQYIEIGAFRGILAQARADEVQRWKQLNHPVSHKIIMQRNPDFEILPGHVIELKVTGQQFFDTFIPYDPGGLGHWTIIYCNDRRDVRN